MSQKSKIGTIREDMENCGQQASCCHSVVISVDCRTTSNYTNVDARK